MSLKEPYKTSRIHLVYRTENSFFRGGRGGGGGGGGGAYLKLGANSSIYGN